MGLSSLAPILLSALVFLVALLRSIKQDYSCLFSVFRLQPRTAPGNQNPFLSRSFLETLPRRSGPPPQVHGILRQCQLSQKGPETLLDDLTRLITGLADTYPSYCYLGRSTFEQGNTTLFSRSITDTEPRYHGEICHAHPRDGSMHLTLHPADVKTVVDAGWGERDPIAQSEWGWWWRLISPASAGFTMIYSPRNQEELDIIEEIIRAAAWWVGGIEPGMEEDIYAEGNDELLW